MLSAVLLVALGLGCPVVSAPSPTRPVLLSEYDATPITVAREMLKLAEVDESDVVFDLGSGDGRIVILAAREFGACGVGVEIDRKWVEESRTKVRSAQVKNRVQILHADFTDVDLSSATVITLYVNRDAISFLRPALKEQLDAGARIVVRGYSIRGWKEKKSFEASDGTMLYLYSSIEQR